MEDYISNYGFHFNKKAFEYAVGQMKRVNPTTGRKESLHPMDKKQIDEILSRNGVNLENKNMYDYAFVFMMAKADYWGSSIEDERHLALFVKDYVDDKDASDETPFRRWLATMRGNGTGIEWDEML